MAAGGEKWPDSELIIFSQDRKSSVVNASQVIYLPPIAAGEQQPPDFSSPYRPKMPLRGQKNSKVHLSFARNTEGSDSGRLNYEQNEADSEKNFNIEAKSIKHRRS